MSSFVRLQISIFLIILLPLALFLVRFSAISHADDSCDSGCSCESDCHSSNPVFHDKSGHLWDWSLETGFTKRENPKGERERSTMSSGTVSYGSNLCQSTSSGSECTTAGCAQYDNEGTLIAQQNNYCINSTTLVEYGCSSQAQCIPRYFNCNNQNVTLNGQDWICIVNKCVARNPFGLTFYGMSFTQNLYALNTSATSFDYQNYSSYWNNTLSGNLTTVCFLAQNNTPLFTSSNLGIINYTLSVSPGSTPIYSGFVNATPKNTTCNYFDTSQACNATTGWFCDSPNITWPYTSAYLSRYIPGSCNDCSSIGGFCLGSYGNCGILSSNQCSSAPGCTWQSTGSTGSCVGTPYCNSFNGNQGNCQAVGCTWQACQGTDSCSNLNSVQCSQQQGCNPATICYGTPTSCYNYNDQISCQSRGCTWVTQTCRECESYCTGTPNATCPQFNGDYADCTNYGCNWQTCQGQAKPCNNLNDYQNCNNQIGCGWIPTEQVAYTNISCLGTANSCGNFSDSASCGLQQGCGWNIANWCNGTVSSSNLCNYGDGNSCNADYRCAWVGSGLEADCTLKSTNCGYWNNTDANTCNGIAGCNWVPYSCQGTPTSCVSYTNSQTCASQSGCHWQTGGNGNSYVNATTPQPTVDRWQQIYIQPPYNYYGLTNAAQVTGISGYGIAPPSGPNSQVIFFDNSNSTSAQNSQFTFPLTIGSGSNRALFVGISYTNTSFPITINSVTYAGQSLSQIISAKSSSYASALYVLTNPPSGSNNMNVVLSGIAVTSIGAASYTGVDQKKPYAAVGSNTTGNGNPSASLTTQNPYDYIVDNLASSYVIGPNSPQLQRWSSSATCYSYFASSCSYSQTAYGSGSDISTTIAGHYNIGWSTNNNGGWSYVYAEINPASASSQDISTTASSWNNVQGNSLQRVCFRVDNDNVTNATINYTLTDASNNLILQSALPNNVVGLCGWYCQDLSQPLSANSLVLNWTFFNATNSSNQTIATGPAYTYMPQFNLAPYPTGNALNSPNYNLWQAIATLNNQTTSPFNFNFTNIFAGPAGTNVGTQIYLDVFWTLFRGGAGALNNGVNCTYYGSTVQSCTPQPFLQTSGPGGCTVQNPSYDFTKLNNVSCLVYDTSNPSLQAVFNTSFYPIYFNVSASLGSLTVGQQVPLKVSVQNNGLFVDNYSVNATSLQSFILISNKQSSVQYTGTLKGNPTNEIGSVTFQVIPQATFGQGNAISIWVNSTNNQTIGQNIIIQLSTGLSSLPDFTVLGIIQIFILAALILLAKK